MQLAEAEPLLCDPGGSGGGVIPSLAPHPPSCPHQSGGCSEAGECDLDLILSSLRETEASLLSEITTAVGREVWGKYLKKEFQEILINET